MRDFDEWEIEEMFDRLDELREQGTTNMNFGPVLLREEFDLTRSEAYTFFTDWCNGFVSIKRKESLYG